MKKCSKCNKKKSLNSFSKNRSRKDGLNSSCKDCHSEYLKTHYKSNKATYKTSNTKTRNRIREYIQQAKSKPCMDCKQSYPYWVMDFDHRDPKQKRFNVSRMHSTGSIELVKTEIDKCDVICANCHRERTYNTSVAQWN